MIKKPRGTEDLFEKKAKEYFALEMIFRNIADLYNYNEIRTPLFEDANLFLRGVGEQTDIVNKEMYIFSDKKDRQLALRPEGTAPVVRAVLENKLYINENLPLKLFYFGSMFRYERPQKGRQREFTTFGVETLGSKSPESDSEIVCLAVNILNSVGIKNYNLYINHLVNGDKRKEYIKELKKQLQNIELCDDCKIRIEKNPLRVLDCKIDQNEFDDIIDMKDYLNDEEKTYYRNFKQNLKNLGITFIEDKKLVRGLDYYTGFVFEIKDKNNLTLIAGGRYDNLVNELGQVDLPASGWGLGVERIIVNLKENEIFLSEEVCLDAYIIGLSEKAKQFCNILLLMLRSANLKVDFDFMGRSLKSAFKQSEKYNSKNIIIIGNNELKENVVILKKQNNKTEKKVKFENIVDEIMRGN
ncbi:histidyl-tRNA synthetase [Spiroplasma helicoides]|uniref:Histidine--tRNA ligase n=1 Tax=Spiroplasma helicoides TaxID=216938 RepID=A0A1B3SKM1_9MOLU|nr:histidine--tRNA ligase [Spiroplasma helicoides]AOG60465.1 histidyl-tRNA synthetase [Spiroplasma helicoides]